ncbi:MAG: DUF11 domain-containing protein [Candidatus Delongbacteria bacterium]|nr:DUF11 domain-containing protein [Candidatus Delongbacteria bacterium]
MTVEEVIELRQAGSGWPRSGINPGELEQRNEPPQYYPGTELRWELQVGNAGSDLPTGLDWTLELPQELVDLQDLVFPLQAENLTDSSGGSWGNGLLRFRVDSLAFDETLTFSFQTTLDSGSVHDALVSCQAALNFDQLEEAMLSDSDPDSSGAQSTDLLVQRALLQGEAQLSAIDTDGNSVTPGDTLLLTLNWINHSSLTLSDVSYSESILPELPGFQLLELPPGAVDNSSDSGGDWGHGQIQIDGLQSEPGDTITCRWQLVVDTVPDSTVVSLQGELSSLSDLLLSDADNDSAGWQPLVLLLRNRPDLSATLNVVVNNSLATGGKQGLGNWFSRKQAPVVLDAEAAPGDRLWWDFQLQNSGTDLVEEVSLAVSLPDWLEDITVEEWSEQLTVIHLPDGGAYGNGQLVATATGLISGDSLEFSFATVIQTSIPDSTILITQGNVTTTALPDTVYSDGDGETPGVQPTEVLVLSPEGELAGNLQLSDLNGGHIQSGDTLRFVSHWENSHLYAVNELTYRHEIPPFTRLTRSGYLPAGALDSLAWSGGEFDRGLIQVTAFDLAGLQTDSLEYWLLVDSLLSQSVTDTTQARLQLADEIWLTDGDLETPGIQPTLFQLLADSAVETIQLQLTRTSTTPLWAGSSSVYELELINQGTGQLDGCSINLPLPDWAEEAAIIAAPTGSLQVEDSDLISAYNFSLAGGETATLELTLSISDLLSAGSIIELQGWCGTLLIPGPVMSNLLTETVQVAPPSITLTLSGAVAGYTVDPGGTVQAQDSLVYNFILTNSGGIQLDNIVLTDTLDNSLRYTGATSAGGTVDFNEGIITISNLNLAPGASLTGALYADIRDPVPLYTVISSQWTAQWDTLSVRSDADPLQPGEQPLNYTVEFAMQLPLLIWDNPARQREVRLVYHAPGANQVSLAVYDVLGERVRSFKNLPAGNGMTLVWHSDNDGGEALANGTYILILKVDDEITREKIALIR